MDRFNRRPTRRQRWRKLALFAGVFLIPATWMGSAVAFGNAWPAARYLLYLAVGLGLAIWTGWELVSRFRLWLRGLNVQPEQGPSFTVLEVAALTELIASPASHSADGPGLTSAEVTLRYNSGRGCITTVEGAGVLRPDCYDRIAWFQVGRLADPVGCVLWPGSSGQLELIELFTTANTSKVDWSSVTFEPATPPRKGGRPTFRPVITEPSWRRFH
jgi:hypothetical protein